MFIITPFTSIFSLTCLSLLTKYFGKDKEIIIIYMYTPVYIPICIHIHISVSPLSLSSHTVIDCWQDDCSNSPARGRQDERHSTFSTLPCCYSSACQLGLGHCGEWWTISRSIWTPTSAKFVRAVFLPRATNPEFSLHYSTERGFYNWKICLLYLNHFFFNCLDNTRLQTAKNEHFFMVWNAKLERIFLKMWNLV